MVQEIIFLNAEHNTSASVSSQLMADKGGCP
jgi:hypothetical protein